MMLTGNMPFETDDTATIMKQIMNGEINCEVFMDDYFDVISDSACDLVKQLTRKDPAKRLSAKQALETTWIKTKINKNDSSNRSLEATKKSLLTRVEKKRSGVEVFER